ncbi:MAG: glycosyltransferase family 4 protein [Fuerstiella sp.]
MQMCRAFADAGHDVTLFSRPGADEVDDYACYGVGRNFNIVKTPAFGTRRIREWRYARATRNEMRRRSPFDLIYGRHLPSLAVAACGDTPFVYEAHQPASRTGRVVEHLLFRRANLAKTVFISEALQQEYLRRYSSLPLGKTQVCHDGAAEPLADARFAVPRPQNARLRVGYIGSFSIGRGAEFVCGLAQRMKDFEFHLCGGTPEAIAKCRRTVLGCENIQFHGLVTPSATQSWQQSMDILLAPYQRNSPIIRWMSPLKVFEYMAARRPIIASDVPVLSEVLTDGVNALLVPPDDHEGWEVALRRLNDTDHRVALAECAYKDFISAFTWDKRVTNVLDGITIQNGSSSVKSDSPFKHNCNAQINS